jgi:hypothetical protein
MRSKLLALCAALFAALSYTTADQASAFGWDRPDQPANWGHERTVRHWVYYPHYRHQFLTHPNTDPYAYHYEPRGYYPYYNSHYWGPPRVKRFRGHLPPYYAAWGANRRHYRHVEWHYKNYGGHRRGHW